MTRRRELLLAGVVLAAIAACDLTTSAGEIASISTINLPSPSVVIGDVMRDSLGAPAPVSIDVFDANGRQITDAHLTLRHLDSTITIESSGLVHGVSRDTVGARIVIGAGGLQTPIARVFVSVAPSKAKNAMTAAPAIVFDSHVDTTAQTNWSPLLVVELTDANGVGAQGFITQYSLVRTPAPLTPQTPTAYLANDAGATSSRDTTDHAGVAGRRVVLRQAAIGDSVLLDGNKIDTIIVRVTASYAGVVVAGMPIDFIVPVSAKKP
jgi:hypothetical protein